jgi:hypothetical protein
MLNLTHLDDKLKRIKHQDDQAKHIGHLLDASLLA